MKHFTITLLFIFAGNLLFAQNQDNPWSVEFGINAVDVHPVGEPTPQGEYFHEFFNVNDHWNILPVLSYVTVSRNLGHGFSLGTTVSLNRISKWGQIEDDDISSGNFPGPRDVSVSVDDLFYFGLDGQITYSFGKYLNKKVEPFVTVGGGYTWIQEGRYNTFSENQGNDNKVGAGTLNGSLGFRYWFNDRWGVSLQSKYKHSFQEYLTKHFQHTAGVVINFGGKDTDGDGIYDKDDACPEVAGLEAFNGCPDSDGDGIEDGKDTCPNTAGLAEFNGCPDTDGDGISDNNDNCPNTAGLASLSGCPDADGDGIADGNDNCPNQAGPAANNGCPWPDTDGDGVLDKDDQCPNEAGTVANNGCPEVALPDAEIENRLTNYARTINFNTGKSTFKEDSYSTLQAIAAILKEYPKANFTIEGHTDSVGSKSSNQLLSERRANAVMDYLVNNGIATERLTAVGYGEDNPIASNATRAGRASNRRVEIKLRN